MKHLALISLIVGTILSAALSLANAQTPSSDPSAPQNDFGDAGTARAGFGTSPGGMGSTGETGGSRGANAAAETTGSGAREPNINSESEYATGADLKGPPAHFPPARTPE